MTCRHCNTPLEHVVIDLGHAPASNSYLSEKELEAEEVFYPLKVFVCHSCWLVQVMEYKKSTEIFSGEYKYFSSYSSSWLDHCSSYCDEICSKLPLSSDSLVVEIASNDGYLLQYFKEKNIPVLGIEPASQTALIAQEKGIRSITEFFGTELAAKLSKERKADLLIGNNVLAHVPDINDFVKGLSIMLAENGIVTMEFPHLVRLVQEGQFDTIYHEHFSYLSFTTVSGIFASCGLCVYDVEELITHGGSLRIYAGHSGEDYSLTDRAKALLTQERDIGVCTREYYCSLQKQADKSRISLLSFLADAHSRGRKVAAYGAAAKGNTLLNYCGIKQGMIDFVVDRSPYKQDFFMPGSHIPIVPEERLKKEKPDFIIILPWNLEKEIIEQLRYTKDWGAELVIPIPEVKIK